MFTTGLKVITVFLFFGAIGQIEKTDFYRIKYIKADKIKICYFHNHYKKGINETIKH